MAARGDRPRRELAQQAVETVDDLDGRGRILERLQPAGSGPARDPATQTQTPGRRAPPPGVSAAARPASSGAAARPAVPGAGAALKMQHASQLLPCLANWPSTRRSNGHWAAGAGGGLNRAASGGRPIGRRRSVSHSSPARGAKRLRLRELCPCFDEPAGASGANGPTPQGRHTARRTRLSGPRRRRSRARPAGALRAASGRRSSAAARGEATAPGTASARRQGRCPPRPRRSSARRRSRAGIPPPTQEAMLAPPRGRGSAQRRPRRR
ncbi:MAG: hypothetical protein QOK40_665, partial [Miltoncostaeaceae bacterium]|nr:hypothetical protein [Miltoncostaeaceae bacterium]